jgi:hypothetical protein
MPSKSEPFTPSSILFRPHTWLAHGDFASRSRPPYALPCLEAGSPKESRKTPANMVEAPGTAPGSDELITTAIYHYS